MQKADSPSNHSKKLSRFFTGGPAIFLYSLVITLVVLELILQFLFPVEFRRPRNFPELATWHELIHRKSDTPGLLYEMTPNMDRKVYGLQITTNSYGMRRDTEPEEGHPEGLRRIAAIGDSFTFGYKVNVEEAYPAQMERILNASASQDIHYEVLNYGVLGYNIHEYAAVLEHKALALEPDWVSIGYVFNDPQPARDENIHLYFDKTPWIEHFNLYRLFAAARFKWNIRHKAQGDYHRYYHLPDSKTWQDALETFERIGQLSRDNDIPVILVIFPIAPLHSWDNYPFEDMHQQVAEAGRQHGFIIVDLLGVYRQYPPMSIRRDEVDNHPSPFGHQLAAEASAEVIKNYEKKITSLGKSQAPMENSKR